ncbi:hypothetical protein [Aliiroseovarius crassostreae]|uniref:hypothetical protein n=1 Tax=Aliiroseovarius crassostreae TaxID=154981 RepID=UPI0020C8B818|nr:hypothetical protein [Aliiroseovarius crassostreae]
MTEPRKGKSLLMSGCLAAMPLLFRRSWMVDWFNNCRLLQPIRNIPPAEAEEKLYEHCNEFDKVA